jgi:hypothetical protein
MDRKSILAVLCTLHGSQNLLRMVLLQTRGGGLLRRRGMRKNRSTLFRGCHFDDQIIILCGRWYLRYSLSYRDLQELRPNRSWRVHETYVRAAGTWVY